MLKAKFNNHAAANHKNQQQQQETRLKETDLVENNEDDKSPLKGKAAAAANETTNKKMNGQKRSDKKKKVTKMVAILTLNFGICWLPTHLLVIALRLFNIREDLLNYMRMFKLIAHTFSYTTPVINPCVYAFYNENFRTSLFDIWNRVTCKSKPSARLNNKTGV
jgi:hypothetical protein